jgi:hypothetical protein
MTIRDPEVVEALRDEPELLALANALQSAGDRVHVPRTERPARRRRIRFAALGLAVAAAVALLLASPWDTGGGPSLVDKALAAVGDQPAIHAVLRFQIGERIDLRTGTSQPNRYDAELWYDSQRHVYRAVTLLDGHVVSHTSGTGDLYGPEGFLLTSTELYRQALQSGKVHGVGRTVVRGHPAIVLEAAQNGGVMRVILDADTYRLLQMQSLRDNHVEYELDVLRFETVSREQAHLPEPQPGGRRRIDRDLLVRIGERRADRPRPGSNRLRQVRVWAGPTVDGHNLGPLQLDHVTATREGRTVRGRTLELDYGPVRPPGYEPYLKLEEIPASDGELWAAQNGYAPPAGYLDLTSGQVGTGPATMHTTWTGKMSQDGFFVQLTSRSRAALIAAARSLHPVP